jgi:hypothetical protein
VVPARNEHVRIWRTHGKYRKQMKRGYSKLLYNQRNKDETMISVIKRLFGEQITSRLVRTQNRELSFRCIAYNTHRLTNLIIILMVSTKPNDNRIIFLLDTIKNIVGALGVLNKYNFLRFIIIRLVFWYRLLS